MCVTLDGFALWLSRQFAVTVNHKFERIAPLIFSEIDIDLEEVPVAEMTSEGQSRLSAMTQVSR